MFVALDPGAPGRPVGQGALPVEGPPERIAAHLRELAEAGADEAIIVVDPITEHSVNELGQVLALLDA